MGITPCVVGVDFGTLSGRALVVRARDGAELGSAVYEYPNAVIEHALPATGEKLGAAWALQDPRGLPRGAAHRGARGAPRGRGGARGDRRHRHRLHGLDADAGPARRHAAVRGRGLPRAPARLPEAVEAPCGPGPGRARHAGLAAERGEAWLARYGGRISSEWEFAKALQVLDEAPDIYEATERWIEAADWIVWELCGRETRNVCTAGYKGIHQDGAYPSRRLPRRARRALRRLRGRQARAPAEPARRPRRRPDRERGGLDRTPRGHRRRHRQRRRARDRTGRAGDRRRPDGGDHGHLHLPGDEPLAAGRGARDVRRGGGRDHARHVGLRGRAERRGRHLRLGRRQARAARLPSRRAREGPRPARVPVGAGRNAGRRRTRSAGARLAQRQPLGARRPRAQRRPRSASRCTRARRTSTAR